ncbi:hypothetical protein [Bdellovibrio sp. HCB2-146]|uniref:hypothetical protein n=1 Tax=Bdellovibrio sp. HCB2-146 TaxID=3394362 RepID=UPI0039BCB0BC
MSTFLNPTIELIEQNPEVKSFIYQQIADFEPFVTPQTVVAVVARDPKKLALQYETEGREFSVAELKKLYRIAIVLKEDDTSVSAEGVHEDIFQAIKLAKENLLKQLIEIQDSVISQQDRIIEINHYLQHPVLH